MEMLTGAAKVAAEVAMTILVVAATLGSLVVWANRGHEPLWIGNMSKRHYGVMLGVLSVAFIVWLILTGIIIVW